MTSIELNRLLERSKLLQRQWDGWESDGTFDLLPSWKPLYRQSRKSWETLHKAIRESAPCVLHMDTSEDEYIGTVGILMDNPAAMFYSEALKDGRNADQEVWLGHVTSIEKMRHISFTIEGEE